MRKEDIKSILKKHNILFWSIAAASAVVVFAGLITVAVFTSSLHAQRTIAAYDTEGPRFSSNYLLRGESRENVRTLYTTNTALPVAGAVTICNYQQGRQTLTYQNDVSYTLTARLVKYDESEEDKYVPVTSGYITSQSLGAYSVTVSDGTTTVTLGNTVLDRTLSGTLAGGTAVSDAYNISFSTNFAQNKPNLYLEMIATPNTVNLPVLRGVFKPDLRAAGATNYWTGSFRDDSSVSPADYDGYNYLVSGTGSGTVTVSWNSAKVAMSDVSIDMLLGIAGATRAGSSITFPVDSDIESRYDLQFYKVSAITENWSQMASQVVTFTFS